MSDFSLMPDNRRTGSLPVSTPTAKVLGVFIAVIIIMFGASQYFAGQKKDAQKSFDSAQTEQKTMETKTQTLKKQLGELEASGGSSKLALITSLANARMDWVPLIMAFINVAEPGIVYSGGFSGTSSSSGSSGSTGASTMTWPLSGSATSKQQFLQFVERLKKVKIKGKPAFTSVVINSVVANDSPQATTGTAQPDAQKGAVNWSVTLTMIPPPAAPEQSTSGSSGTSGTSGSGG